MFRINRSLGTCVETKIDIEIQNKIEVVKGKGKENEKLRIFLKITNVSGTRKGENQNVCDFSQNDTVFSFSFLSNLYTGDCIPKLIKKTNKQTNKEQV